MAGGFGRSGESHGSRDADCLFGLGASVSFHPDGRRILLDIQCMRVFL